MWLYNATSNKQFYSNGIRQTEIVELGGQGYQIMPHISVALP